MTQPAASPATAPHAQAVLTPDEAAAQIIARPGDKLLLRRCIAAVAPDDPEAGLDWACAIQASQPAPIQSILLELAARRGEDAPRARFGTLLDASLDGALAPVRAAWEALLDRRAIDPETARSVARDTRSLAAAFFRFALPTPRLLHLTSDHPRHRAELAAAGIAVQPMRDFLAGFLQTDPAWAAAIAAAKLPSDAARARVERAERECGWVDRTIATGRLTVADPLDGTPRDATDGLIAFGRGLYRFDGVEPFFLLTGGPWNAPQGLFLPRRNAMLSFGGEWRHVLGPEALGNLLTSYLRRRALPPPAPSEGPPGFTLYLPPTDNFAHQHWNFQTGVERLIRLGLADQVAAVRFSGTEFFGAMAELFPDLARQRMERPRREAIVDPAPGDPARLVLPAAGYFIPRSLTERVIRLLRTRPRGRPDAIEPADIARAPGEPVVWLALRVRGRAWVGQEEGFAHIIRHIAARRPDALFLLDGFSFPVGDDGTSHQWAGAVQTLRAMADRVRSGVPDPGRVISMIGNTMRESVLWAAETDVYLAPFGTTQHKVGWFSEAPGLVYAPPAFKPSQVAQSPGFAAAEISTLPRLVIGQPTTTSSTAGIGPAREVKDSTVDVTLDATEMAEALWDLLQPRFPALA